MSEPPVVAAEASPWAEGASVSGRPKRARTLAQIASSQRRVLSPAIDGVMVALAMLLSYRLSPVFQGSVRSREPLLAAAVYAAGFVLVAYAAGLYDWTLLTSRLALVVRTVGAVAVAIVIPLGFFYWTLYRPIGRWVIASTVVLSVPFVLLPRGTLAMFWPKRRVLFLGDGPLIATLKERLAAGAALHEVVGTWSPRRAGLAQWCATEAIDEIVLPSAPSEIPSALRAALACLPTGCRVRSDAQFYEDVLCALPARHVSADWMLNRGWDTSNHVAEAVKRSCDIVLALVLLVLASPVIVLTVLALWMARGPVLYAQVRTGRYGRPFRILKFRTMHEGAEQGTAQWAQHDDPRRTRLGRVLRRTRIDELPQLVNILLGEMSFVGPRPERPEFVEQLEQALPYYAWRHLVRPGLTGWAQINCPYGSSFDGAYQKLEYDLYYIRHYSPISDLAIALRTAAAAVRGAR